jgi:1,2-diacylglycerol 3-alpha-glucosyltransferase
MKITIICDYFDGEAEYHESLHARYLESMGHDVSIICSTYKSIFKYYARKSPPQQASITKYGESTVFRLPYKIFIAKRLFYFKSFLLHLNHTSPDIIYIHGINLNNLGVLYYKKFVNHGVKLICDFHGDEFNSAKGILGKYILHRLIYRLLYSFCEAKFDRIFAVSPSSLRFILKYYVGNPSKVKLLPLGSDVLRIKQRSKMLLATGSSQCHADFDLTVVTGGKIRPNSQIDNVLEAISDIGKEKRIKIIIFGVPVENYQIEFDALLKKYNGCVDIEYLGWINPDKIIDTFLLSDVAVFLGGQSILWQHALSCGVPLILDEKYKVELNYNNEKYIDNGDNIDYVNIVHMPKNLKQSILKLATDHSALSFMKLRSSEVAAEVLNIEKIIQEMLSVESK